MSKNVLEDIKKTIAFILWLMFVFTLGMIAMKILIEISKIIFR